jgi:hypothetical protein
MEFPCYVVYVAKSPTREDVYVGCVKCKTAKKWENYRTSSNDWKNQTDAVLTPFVVMPGDRDDYPDQHAWRFERQLWDYLKSIGVTVQKKAPNTHCDFDTAEHARASSERFLGVPLTPEHRDAVGNGVKRYYDETPGAREQQSERLRKCHEENPDISVRQGESLRRYYEDTPGAREAAGERIKRYFETPDAKEQQSERIKRYYETPGAKEQQSERIKRYYDETPGAREKTGERVKRYHEENPDAGKEHSERLRRYYEENPVTEEARKAQSERNRKRYEDPIERSKVGERNRVRKLAADYWDVPYRKVTSKQIAAYKDYCAYDCFGD